MNEHGGEDENVNVNAHGDEGLALVVVVDGVAVVRDESVAKEPQQQRFATGELAIVEDAVSFLDAFPVLDSWL